MQIKEGGIVRGGQYSQRFEIKHFQLQQNVCSSAGSGYAGMFILEDIVLNSSCHPLSIFAFVLLLVVAFLLFPCCFQLAVELFLLRIMYEILYHFPQPCQTWWSYLGFCCLFFCLIILIGLTSIVFISLNIFQIRSILPGFKLISGEIQLIRNRAIFSMNNYQY